MLKTKKVKSALPLYMAALVWIVYSLIFPMYKLVHLLVCAALSVAVCLVGGKLFPARTVEYEEKPSSGDAEVDRQIEEGRKGLSALRQANADIESPVISAKLDRMERAARQIFDLIEQEPRKALRVRKFMNYYLPTSVKLLEQYRELIRLGNVGENAEKSKKCVEDSLEMIASAFERQLDNLFSDQALDISSDIRVLETMLVSEGLATAQTESKKSTAQLR